MGAGVVTAQVGLELELLAAGGDAAAVRPVRPADALALLVRAGPAAALPVRVHVVHSRGDLTKKFAD